MLDPSLHAPRLLTPFAIGISLGLLSALEADVTSVFVDEVSLPTIGSITGGLTAHGDAYFFGSDDEDTAGLWRTDGSALGSVRVTDQEVADFKVAAPPYLYYWVDKELWCTNGVPSRESLLDESFGTAPKFEDVRLFGGLDGSLFWLDNIDGGWDLRRLTHSGGNVIIKHLPRGGAPSFAGAMTQDGASRLVFYAPDEASASTALWITDGTEAGTVILDTEVHKDQEPLLAPNQSIYYLKRIDGHNRLYRSRGTPGSGGPVPSAEDEDFTNPDAFLIEPSALYFQAEDTPHGTELWRVPHLQDASATRVVDLNEGNNSSSPEPLAVFQSAVWTMARVDGKTRLWQVPLEASAEGGPTLVDLPEDVEDHYFHQAIASETTVYLASGPSASSREYWLTRSDGTTRGDSETFEDTWLNQRDAIEDGYPHLYPSAEGALFPSFKVSVGTEIHRLGPEDDPTVVKDANTTPIADSRATIIQPVPRSTEIQYFTINHENEHEYVHLTTDGVRKVIRSDIATDIGWSLTPNHITGITFFRDTRGLWSLLPGGSSPSLILENRTVRAETNARNFPFSTTDSGVIFMGVASTPLTLLSIMHSSGLPGSVADVLVSNEAYKDQPVNFEGKRYFVMTKPILCLQPWYTTGPNEIARFITFPSEVRVMGATGSHMFFSQGNQLWSYDGRLPLELVGPQAATSFHTEPPAADSEDRFYYIGRNDKGVELWVTDGTRDKTERLTDIKPGESIPFYDLTPVEDSLFFGANVEDEGLELWMSEGSEDTTRPLTDWQPGEDSSLPEDSEATVIGALGDYAYFAADDGIRGMELWRVHHSGSPNELVHDLVPGPGSSHPHNFVNINGRLFFQATDRSHALVTLREIVELPPFDPPISIRLQSDRIILNFGQDIAYPYLLMRSTDLDNWSPIRAYFGDDLNRKQEVILPRLEGTHYYRLQR